MKFKMKIHRTRRIIVKSTERLLLSNGSASLVGCEFGHAM